MKQSEKYDLLQYALWHTIYTVEQKDINDLLPKRQYFLRGYPVTGEEIQDIWIKLLEFRNKAKSQELIKKIIGGEK